MRHELVPLTKARNTALVNLGVVIHHEHVGEAVTGAEARVANDFGSTPAVAVARVGTACAFPLADSRSMWLWIETAIRRRHPGDSVHPNHPALP